MKNVQRQSHKQWKKIAIAATVIVVMFVATVYAYYYDYYAPLSTAPTPNSSWLLVIPKDPNIENIQDQHDYQAMLVLKNKYGIPTQNCWMLSESTKNSFNNVGQNIIIIGGWAGQTALKDFAPWVEFWTFSLQRPTAQPSVRWYGTSWEDFSLQTPEKVYTLPQLKTLGSITVGYDLGLRRYIVIGIGWDQAMTKAVADHLADLLPTIKPGGYVIIDSSGTVIERG